MKQALIQLEGVGKRFGEFRALSNCTMSVATGEVVVICGPSGSGKSTLIKCINALIPINEGHIYVDGVHVNSRRTNAPKLRSRIGMVFQNFELYPHLSVLDNICLGQRQVLKRSRNEAVSRAEALLQRVGMLAHKNKFPSQLSGGQQQRVAIARSLAMDPIAMLFDEPTSALDPEMINEVLDVLSALATEGMTMIVVTHEMGFARRVADRIVFMDEGRIIETADTETFFNNPKDERSVEFLSKILPH